MPPISAIAHCWFSSTARLRSAAATAACMSGSARCAFDAEMSACAPPSWMSCGTIASCTERPHKVPTSDCTTRT
eukprot:2724095-Prymnesium_polylepis.1